MSTYEQDHNITSNTNSSSGGRNRNRPHQTLTSLIESFLTQDTSANTVSDDREAFTNALRTLDSEQGSEMAQQLLQFVEDHANLDPLNPSLGAKGSQGVPQEFLDSLERVPISKLANSDTADCPICTNRFLDDEHPLIVKLPCSVQSGKDHIFDLECIGPWLKVHSTCPLCRFDVLEVDRKRREKLEKELQAAKDADSEEEEEGWDVYG
ncbi:uncharacterized protein RJT20DRAFT_5320 [Scheffersomyces xylosifermentans]|uniref:uncharacterized protein n=1 Tax=Scheffersomyces xylosifermentans TaxID=1304137 RepID=UPI00315C8ABD